MINYATSYFLNLIGAYVACARDDSKKRVAELISAQLKIH